MIKAMFTVGRMEFIASLKEQFRQAAMNDEYELMNDLYNKLKDLMLTEEFNVWARAEEYDDNGNPICLEGWNSSR